jgi:SAM-dependent methyltransferase
VPSIDELRERALAASPFDPEKTQGILEDHFARVQRRLAFALQRWPELAREAVLDVGCSYGHCLAHFGPGSVGIDSNAQHVAFAQSLGLDARVVEAHGELGLPPGSFDSVWLCDVIEHLVAPHAVLRGLRPVLKPRGRLIVYMSVAPSPRLARQVLGRFDASGFLANAHHYQFTYDTARFLVERAGYRVTEAVPAIRLPKRMTTRMYLVARPDDEMEKIAARAELRNRGGTTRPPL